MAVKKNALIAKTKTLNIICICFIISGLVMPCTSSSYLHTPSWPMGCPHVDGHRHVGAARATCCSCRFARLGEPWSGAKVGKAEAEGGWRREDVAPNIQFKKRLVSAVSDFLAPLGPVCLLLSPALFYAASVAKSDAVVVS